MNFSMGWLPELPDLRDYDAHQIARSLLPPPCATAPGVSTRVDIRQYCSPIENQGALGSCTAQAVAGLAEYYERVRYGRHIDVSRLFVYKMARQLDGFVGDTGSHIRTAMKSIRLFGAPPERFWPYRVADFELDPTPFVFAYGQSLQGVSHYRLDLPGYGRAHVLDLTKTFIGSLYPVVFGFSVYTCNHETGEFFFPGSGDRRRGGHAVMAVGYDDNKVVGDRRGALLIRNSWGTGWGDGGYGWVPYDFVLRSLSSDFWILIRKESVMD